MLVVSVTTGRAEDPTEGPTHARRSDRRQPKRLSPAYLENAALGHLARYAASVAGLRRVLVRKIDRSLRVHGGDRSDAVASVDELIARLVRRGLLNDGAYAAMKARSLRAAGRSGRAIALKLRTKGVAHDLAAKTVAATAADVSEDAAARIWARKRRIGPYRRDAASRGDHRQRDLAALARAGFTFSVAKRIVDGEG
jgi:regulatory protein